MGRLITHYDNDRLPFQPRPTGPWGLTGCIVALLGGRQMPENLSAKIFLR